MNNRFQRLLRLAGKAGLAFLIFMAAYLALPSGPLSVASLFAAIVTGTWVTVRILKAAFRFLVWRLRHRLLVTYLFISVVPIALVVSMALVSTYALVSQLAVYLVTTELDRRIATLADAGTTLAGLPPERWPEAAAAITNGKERNPKAEVLVRSKSRSLRYPAANTLEAPPAGWKSTQGVLLREGRPYLWSYQKSGSADLTIVEPFTREMLVSLAPNLGIVNIANPAGKPLEVTGAGFAPQRVPPPKGFLDRELAWFTTVPVSVWEKPEESARIVIGIRTRVSAVVDTIFDRATDLAQGVLLLLLAVLGALFPIAVVIAAAIGAAMTRSITAAVHDLYQGTQHVSQGDFSHRIPVRNSDQLGDLSRSFNGMTAHVENLLTIAKEKERLESEVEIGREVQRHLYPRSAPQSTTLRLSAMCYPARTVSGDYYDYASLGEPGGESRLALAMGDVAGKGISAALLMASLQSGLRTDWQGDGDRSTSTIVARLNRQLHSNTSPEKYATFFLGIYDEALSVLTYTNAGHLPPLLIRKGTVQLLEINGMVVGLFPAAKYDQSYLTLEPGDLLVFYTDGVTEPENTFGEMFGEERLTELLLRNVDRPEAEILAEVYEAVRQWTGSEELQDDLTLMLARRI